MRRISLSILLVMVLTMTTCVATSGSQYETSEPTIITTVEPTEEEFTSATIESKYKFRYWTVDEIEAMSPEEVSNLFDEMVCLSEAEDLSAMDMYQIGLNFHDIWWYNSAYEQSELEAQSYEAFCNVYDKAIEQQVPLEKIYSWTYLPVPNVLHKYFSSDNFSSTMNITCAGFYPLAEEDAIYVAEGFFENPLFATNCSFASNALSYPSTTVQDMAWEHLVNLSKTTDSKVSEYTYWICWMIFKQNSISNNTDKVYEIAQNIIENPNFSFEEKYNFFYNEITDEKLLKIVSESFLKLDQHTDDT